MFLSNEPPACPMKISLSEVADKFSINLSLKTDVSLSIKFFSTEVSELTFILLISERPFCEVASVFLSTMFNHCGKLIFSDSTELMNSLISLLIKILSDIFYI